MNFCHLHIHDQFSLLDGVGTCETYVAKAKSLKFEYLACTNHANIDGLIKFQKCCTENEIKPILGCELYIVEDLKNKAAKEKRGHILILVKDAAGWQNLTKMLSIANMDGFYYKPRIDYKTLLDHSE
ncbi:PHP domain-containing protein, partial [Patescibacteria group bacterium]|nr:PHP domain-containing protein [Patescibacteria group bacterium]